MPKYRFRLAIASLIIVLAAGSHACAAMRWKELSGADIWSLAWSPDGRYIAMVTAKSNEPYGEGVYVSAADFWLLSTPINRERPVLKHLTRRDKKMGLPLATFWLSDKEIGWVASAQSASDCSLKATSIANGVTRKLANRTFPVSRDPHAAENCNGPSDAYYDLQNRLVYLGGSRNQLPVVGTYNTKTGNFAVTILSKHWVEWVWIAGVGRHAGSRSLYAASEFAGEDSEMAICRFDTKDLSRRSTVVGFGKGLVIWPRLSPDGKQLAWMDMYVTKVHRGWKIIVYDIASNTRSQIVSFLCPSDAETLGCPYTWSPDSSRIAYTNGERVGVVRVRK